MFPFSYFPDAYFTPSYWPKLGLTPPGIIRILINGVECTDFIYYQEAIYWNLVRGSRGTCNLPFIVRPGQIFAPQAGELIEIYDPANDRRWIGTVETISIRWIGDDGFTVVAVGGVSYEQLFDTIEIEKIKFTGVSCASAFTTLHTLSGVSVVGLGTIEGDTIIQSLEVTNIAAGFNAIALLCGGVWYVDPADANIYLHAPTSRAADFVLESEDVLWESMQWRQSRADYRDTQVIQLPGISMSPVIATFNGDDTTTVFTLPSIPQYIISVAMSIGSFARATAWQPGTDTVTVTPALPTGSTLTVRYSDTGLVSSTTPGPGIGSKTVSYSRTRTFTPEGGLQEVNAILARYSMLPSELTFTTDKPGLQIARNLEIDLDKPEGCDVLVNGHWLIREIDAAIVPGLDQRAEPFGHFRYTIRLVNTAATAVFQGDGETTIFELPVVPTEIANVRIGAPGREGTWTPDTTFFEIVPALGPGESAAVDYIDPNNSPDIPTFVNTWEEMQGGGAVDPVVLSSDPPGTVPGEEIAQQTFIRTLTLYNLAVGDDIAPHTLVYNDGTGYRLTAVLRKDMDSDLTIRITKGTQFLPEELITVTVPGTAVVDDTFEWPLAQGSPPVLVPFFDGEILIADILESDGSSDVNGVIQFTVQWTKNPIEQET